MAHKTLIGGTAHEIIGGKTLVDGTAYSIKNGKILAGGTAYEVAFGPEFVTVYDFGTLTAESVFGFYRCTVKYDDLPFDLSKCNAYMVDGVVYEAVYGKATNSYYNIEFLNASGTNTNSVTTSSPASFTISHEISTGKWTVYIYVLAAGTYDLKIGTV